MVAILFYFLTPLLIRAQTITEPSHGFTIDLFHRYSSKSPFYNPSISNTQQRLQQSLLDSSLRYRYIKRIGENKVESNITLIPNQGDYLIKVLVGTPAVELTAVVSTASDITWFQCRPCETRYHHQNTALFNPTLSSTYKVLPCNSTQCCKLGSEYITCDQMSNECKYWYTYGNGTLVTHGVMGTDLFSFSFPNETRVLLPSSVFGCGYDQFGSFDQNSMGVVSLDSGPLSLVTQLGHSIGFKFSYCLASTASAHTSKLKFGSDVETGLGTITTTPYTTKNNTPFYSLNLTGISLGAMSVQVGKDIVIDIGTSLTYLNPSTFSKLKAMVNEALGTEPISQPPNELLCYDRGAQVLDFPDIVFRFSGGDLKLKAYNALVEYDGFLCLSIVMSEHDYDPMVLGNMAQVNFDVHFDIQTKMVSFAQKDCALEGNSE